MQEQPILQGVEWRERIYNMCKASALYDAAFLSSYYNRMRTKEFSNPAPAIDLQELFQNTSPAEISEAIAAAKRLDSSCNQFADYFYSKNAPKDLLQAIETLHPGFSEASYTSVLGRAQVMAR